MSSVKGIMISIAIFFALLCIPVSSPAANPCFSTLGSDIGIYIPVLIFGDSSYALDMAYNETGPGLGTGIWFEITGVESSTVSDCTNPARLLPDSESFLLNIPVLQAGSSSIWLSLECCPTGDGKIWFKAKDYGLMLNKVFVTTEQGTGDLSSWSSAGGKSGIEAADAVCQAAAQTAGLPGTFVALLSDENTDFYCHLHSLTGKKENNCGQAELPAVAGPWVRTDGFPFAPSAEQLFTKYTVYVPAICDESGNRVPDEAYYWSGTSIKGALGGKTCSNWSESSGSDSVVCGSPFGNGIEWVNGSTSWACAAHNRLLCMQTGTGPDLPDFTSPGKIVFVTSVDGNGNLSSWPDAGGKTGIAAGDAICQARAEVAGLDNARNFKAWLSSTKVDAGDRLVTDGPWRRLDGVIVARNKSDLTDGSLFTGINQTETGKYWYGATWTGTSSNGVKTSNNCNGWSDGSDALKGDIGCTEMVNDRWSIYLSSPACDRSLQLFCFED